ncbi:MAG TPA: PhzF family phenazine biosynthesis protein [Nocardioidaceae bacterium]|nr:PhzF family phenazine biosynthesis protein [Nocardioidaceae bacterium]
MLAYDIVDVFTDRPFAGNQLAVVHGADELSTEQCQAIAQEFNFSETTFPSTEVVDGAAYSTRIFTPGGEIPFAGHPTLGTAWVLRSRGLLSGSPVNSPVNSRVNSQVTQECGAGRIGIRFSADLVELTASPRDLLGPVDDELAASLLDDVGLSAADLAGPVWLAGCGLSFAHIPVIAGAVERAVASSRPLGEYAERLAALGTTLDPLEGLNVVHLTGSAPTLSVHSRVFTPGPPLSEDAATGSAAAGLGMALVAAGRLPEGGTYAITQGVEMGRPSSLRGCVETTVRGGHGWSPDGTDQAESRVAALCRVAGQVHHVATGEMVIPDCGPQCVS